MITVTYCILQITLVKYAYLFVAYRIGVGKNDRLRIVKLGILAAIENSEKIHNRLHRLSLDNYPNSLNTDVTPHKENIPHLKYVKQY